MKNTHIFFIYAYICFVPISFISCGLPVEEQLILAEEKLDEALKIGASDVAPKDYRKAQVLFDLAMEAMRENNFSGARGYAKRSILCSEDGINRVKKHERNLEAEDDRLKGRD